MENKKIKVVIIDDSILIRNIISDQLKKDECCEVIAVGKTGLDCIDLAQKLKPDIIILDIEMPVMNGLTALEEMQKKGIKVPIIMLSGLTQTGAKETFRALELGAIDFVPKPSGDNKFDPEEIGELLKSKIRGYFSGLVQLSEKTEIRRENKTFQKILPVKAIGIGTSTGGPKALQHLFTKIPAGFIIPIFIVQHMPRGFTKAFAERLNEISPITVKEAEDGETVKNGYAYLAPGDCHMSVVKSGSGFNIAINQNEPVNGHRPSVDVTLKSLVEIYGGSLMGVIMTGMGKDGADSIKLIHDAGGATLAQDQNTSVVFGMNRVAIENGGVDLVVGIDTMMNKMQEIIDLRGAR